MKTRFNLVIGFLFKGITFFHYTPKLKKNVYFVLIVYDKFIKMWIHKHVWISKYAAMNSRMLGYMKENDIIKIQFSLILILDSFLSSN